MPQRVANWDTRVVEWATTRIGQPFAWGTMDCTTLLREMVVVMYDRDLLPPVAPYATKTEALRRLAALSAGGIGEELTRLGATRHPIGFAQTGDVLVSTVETDDDVEALVAIVVRDRLLTATHDAGVTLFPLPAPDPHIFLQRLPDADG